MHLPQEERKKPRPKPSLAPGQQGQGSTAPRYPYYPESFLKRLERTIQDAGDEGSEGALLLVSINNLAMIMNGCGNVMAEQVVTNLSNAVRNILAEGDWLERVQHDQLGIMLTHCYREDVAGVANRINNLIQNYGRENAETASLHVICSIASVRFPIEAGEALDALNKAYIALHSSQGAYYRTFESTHAEADQCRQQMGLANYLHRALKEQRVRLAYQPIIESATGTIAHYEALLRMTAPNGKISSAGALIPVAERMGLIDIIDSMVLDMVITELRHSPDVSLAFNVSNMTTENPLWMERLNAYLAETPELASRLIVEITETAAQRDLRRTAYFVASLQSQGCQVALDDFGSGYTSFRQLKALSVDFVKIDGVFIKDLAVNTDSRFFVKTLMDFAKGFGLKAVAEFVENGEIAKILLEMGVDYMQGYYFGKPENHRSWLSEGEYKKD